MRLHSYGQHQGPFGKTISSSCFCLLPRMMSPYGRLSLRTRGTLIMCLFSKRTNLPLTCWRTILWPARGMCTTRAKILGCLWFNSRRNFTQTNLMVVVSLLTSPSWFSRFRREFISGEGRTTTFRFNSWLVFSLRRFKANLRWSRILLERLQLPDERSGEHNNRSESARQLKAELTYCILNFGQAERWNCVIGNTYYKI